MEENVEYVEKEDEFDIHPISVIHKRRLDQEDEDVDVLTIEPLKTGTELEGQMDDFGEHAAQGGAGGVGEEEFRMPVLLDLSESESEEEIVAVGPGTMRRKSPGEGKSWLNGQIAESGDEKTAAKKPATNGTSRRSRRK